VLLRRLREIMTEPVSGQARLDKIVIVIASNMVAEACSVYVLREDGGLELYATEGLNRKAVHRAVLNQEEGLVGLVAREDRAINVSDVQSHPAFSARRETGDEDYQSFLGVPILRAGKTLVVLAVQNRAQRTYTEEEEEALQTTAMVLAEMIVSGELRPAKRRRPARTRKAITGRSEIPEIQPSKEKLVQVKELLDGCVGADVDPRNLGNQIRLPLHSDILDTIRTTVDAGIRLHDCPLVTRHHVTMLERIRTILIDFNKTLEVLNGSASKATKLLWGISKLAGAGAVAVPTIAVFMIQLSSAVAAAIGSLGAAIAACRATLGL